MNPTLLVVLALLVGVYTACGQASSAYARASSADFNPQSHVGSAVDAKGVRHYGGSYKGSPPWLLERRSGIAADYPYEERRQHHEGTGMFRLDLDLKTGRVVNVGLIRSTGFRALDSSAVSSFRTWTWRPGRWREIDVGIAFRMGNASAPPLPGMVRLPPH